MSQLPAAASPAVRRHKPAHLLNCPAAALRCAEMPLCHCCRAADDDAWETGVRVRMRVFDSDVEVRCFVLLHGAGTKAWPFGAGHSAMI